MLSELQRIKGSSFIHLNINIRSEIWRRTPFLLGDGNESLKSVWWAILKAILMLEVNPMIIFSAFTSHQKL